MAGISAEAQDIKSHSRQINVEVAQYRGNRQCAVSLTFDDGIQEDYTLIAPHLDRYGLKGTFCINGAFINDLDDHYAPRLTWDQCREMDNNGHEIASHSWSHINEYEASIDITRREIEKNDSAIIREIGKRPLTYFFPFNAYTQEALSAAMENRIACRLYQFPLGQRNSNATWQSITKWVEEQKKQNKWGVTMTHGIFTAWDQWDEPWILWDFFKLLAQQSDTVWTAPFADVASYVAERDNVTLSVQRDSCLLYVKPSISLNHKLFSTLLTLNIYTSGLDQELEIKQDGKQLLVQTNNGQQMVDFDPFGGEITIRPLTKNEIDMRNSKLTGKRLAVIGDSYVQNHVAPVEHTWHYKLAQKYGMEYFNYGINGNCIAFDHELYGPALYKRYKEMSNPLDYIIVIAGHNDAYNPGLEKAGIGGFKQRLASLCEGLRHDYPQAGILFFTPWKCDNFNGSSQQLVVDAMIEVCGQYDIPIFDAARNSNIDPTSVAFREKYFQWYDDEAHLNEMGHLRFQPLAEQFFLPNIDMNREIRKRVE